MINGYTIKNVKFCSTMETNPIDGSYYFDHINIESYIAFNGLWHKYEIACQEEYQRRNKILKTRIERKEKLKKIYEG
jgi:hypothetical protein